MQHRELFTKEQINIDLRAKSHTSPACYLLCLIGLATGTLFVWLTTITAHSIGIRRVFVFLLASTLPLMFLLMLIGTVKRALLFKRLAETSDYHVVMDELTNDNLYSYSRKWHIEDFAVSLDRPGRDYITFKCYGPCHISMKNLYSWSKYAVASETDYDVAYMPGDTYYVVTDDYQRPLLFYSTRLFEYKELTDAS